MTLHLEISPITWDPDDTGITTECEECENQSCWEIIMRQDQDVDGLKARYCQEHFELALPFAADLTREEN